ncbi:Gfo/Idh/MocA family oxidoreductase, partial [Georgenia sp. 10Sc9-8]|nr:Gfo/Idh/MocA family oxidoreductase [Georgenia halotolerans]
MTDPRPSAPGGDPGGTTGLPVAPDPRTAPPLRWGILGAGGIAGAFARDVPAHSTQQVVAVGSRDRGRAADFADRHSIPGVHGSYAELVHDPQVDVVYVATPHSHHHAHARLALEAGKPVLVEKAFTRNEAEAQHLFDLADRAGLFVMEAMWTRFLPHMVALRGLVASGALGELVLVQADHGQRLDSVPRLLDPALAGGA